MPRHQKNTLSSERVVYLRSILFNYAIHKHGLRSYISQCTAEINQYIYRLHESGEKSDFSNISLQTVSSFLNYGRKPTIHNGLIYEGFLIYKRFISTGYIHQISSEIQAILPTHSDNFKKIDNINGLYYHEGYGDQDSIIIVMVISGESLYSRNIDINERIYKKKGTENALEYKERMDHGEFCRIRVSSGIARKLGCVVKIEIKEQDDNEDISFAEAISLQNFNQKSLELIHHRDYINRDFLNLTPETRKQIYDIKKFTVRQINNISSNRVRGALCLDNHEYVNNIININRRNRAILTEYDEKLLDCATENNAIGMIEALVAGADINAQDPETGMTALHYVAEQGNQITLAVLVRGSNIKDFKNIIPNLYEEFRDKPNIDLVELDLKLRENQAQLDPTILCNKHFFASNHTLEGSLEEMQKPENMYLHDHSQVRMIINHYIGASLAEKGIHEPLYFAPIKHRLRVLGLDKENPFPEPSL